MRTLHTFYIFLIFLTATGCKESSHGMSKTPSDSSELNYKKKSIIDELKANENLPIADRVALYYELKTNQYNNFDFDRDLEHRLNLYGYELLWAEQKSDAIAIFNLVIQEFPESSNAYDSMGDGYQSTGQDSLAIVNFKKSLALDPDNFHAEDQIEKMLHINTLSISTKEKFSKVYSTQQYLEDIDQLADKLIQFHPNIFKFSSEENFWKTVKEKKTLINENTSYAMFRWHCMEIIANVNCSHTSMIGFHDDSYLVNNDKRFPIVTRLINDTLYIINPLENNADLSVKDIITSINGKPTHEIINDIYRHINSQGHITTSKTQDFNVLASEYISFALNFPQSFWVTKNDSNTKIHLVKTKKFEFPIYNAGINYCSNGLCIDYWENNTALLTVSTFNYYYWNAYDEFVTFMDKNFSKMKKLEVKNLIIDLRWNHGGSPESSIYLLRYLAEKPFNYLTNSDYKDEQENIIPHENRFTGNVYYIIDGNGKSTTGHFMAKVKQLKLGTIIGEELGSNQFCTANQRTLRLKNTKTLYSVARSTSEIKLENFPDEQGILPDFPVTQDIDDYLNKVDSPMKFTKGLIKDK